MKLDTWGHMPPPPKIDPSLVRQAFFDLNDRRGRPASAADVAEYLRERTGTELKPSTIRGMVNRYGWTDLPRVAPVGRGAMEYQVVRELGPVKVEHRRQNYWFLITAYERVQAGLADADGLNAHKARNLIADLLRCGNVVDYSETGGFYVRSGWPWEFGDYLAKRERPEDWPEHLKEALRASKGKIAGAEVTKDHRQRWAEALLAEMPEELG